MTLEPVPDTAAALLAEAGWKSRLTLTAEGRQRLVRGRAALLATLSNQHVYGVHRGFGPLADFPADPDPHRHGIGLLQHLMAGQGVPLPPAVTRLMVWLRLRGMTLGHSGADPAVWERLAELWNSAFVPVVPQDGSLSASGDLVPLAHAAFAMSGAHDTEAWVRDGNRWRREPAAVVLARSGLQPVHWEARSALAFVNGTSAGLARALTNHVRLNALAHAAAALTGRIGGLLGVSVAPFEAELAEVRGHAGHHRAAELIRRAWRACRSNDPGAGRPFQEPYSLRCAPQVIGAVLDQLRLQESVLVTEAGGCTDNPVVVGGRVHHGGNFHAAPIALASDQHTVCLHQLAYLLERQLALAVDPHRNGGLPPLLAADPGRNSGLAGVQIAASSHLAAIRQAAYPASCTPVPTNLGNQDHVPMALNGANAVATMLDRAWWIAASVAHATSLIARIHGRVDADPWGEYTPDLSTDRPMATAVATLAARLEQDFAPPGEPGAEDWTSR